MRLLMSLAIFLPSLWIATCNVPSLRELTVACRNPNETLLHCGTYPPGCEKSSDYSCELLITARNYDLPCILGNLNDPYIQTLCSKRSTTYLFTILRSLPVNRLERSCRKDNTDEYDEECKYREFVAVVFKNNTGDLDDTDVIYACIPGDDLNSLYTFDTQGKIRVRKFQGSKDKLVNKFERRIFPESGIGVFWINMQELTEESSDLGCQFVLSVSDQDLDYNGGNTIPLSVNVSKPSHIIMAAGWTTVNSFDMQNENDDEFLENEIKAKNPYKKKDNLELILKVNNTPAGTSGGGNTSGNSSDNAPPPIITKMNVLDLSKLLRYSKASLPGTQDRVSIQTDHELHEKKWKPVYDICQTGTGLCYTIGDSGCFKDISESCQVLASIQFQKKFKEIKINLIVENAPWGGIAFSQDRRMGDDIGFFCQSLSYTTQTVRVQLNKNHAVQKGNDTRLKTLVANAQTFRKKTEDEKLCTWTLPVKFEVNWGPDDVNKTTSVDLSKDEYYILLSVGNTLLNDTAHHKRRRISDIAFSKSFYKSNVKSFGTSQHVPLGISKVFLLPTILTFYLYI